ncbi:MAG: hypothetical protein E7635_00285 [Ruminococcaceae bacterium]|nr:hypothetical protein [Oscillospiraceae bacterium]
MKTTIRMVVVVAALLLITFVMIFVISCDQREKQAEENRWLTVSEQLELYHMSNEESMRDDEIVSSSDSKAAIGAEAVATAPATEDKTKEALVSQVSGKEITYVLNTNSEKFHKPDCSSVSTMKNENRRDFYGTREEVMAMNYDPCGRCKP